MPNLSNLETNLRITFTNKGLLDQAFIHRSYLNESHSELESNERLEFLGDAVLELATSLFLYRKLPAKPEGYLTNLRSSLVKTETLAEVATILSFGNYLSMSKGEEISGGRTNVGLLANTVESFIGALYLDQGFDAVQNFLATHLFPKLENILKNKLDRDAKSLLQESVQSQGKPTPIYRVVSQTGPDHHKTFVVQVLVGTHKVGQGSGPSKQKAEQAAAEAGLANLGSK